jgi:hypothetical protein
MEGKRFGAARKLFFLPSRPDVGKPIRDGAFGSSPASSPHMISVFLGNIFYHDTFLL